MNRRSLRVAVLVISCAVTAAPSFAGIPVSLPLGDVPGSLPLTVQTTCTIEPYAGGDRLLYWGPDNAWTSIYLLVSPSDCVDCTKGVIQINSVEFASQNYFGTSCAYTLEVSVVGVIDGACPAPDEAVVLCGPTEVEVPIPTEFAPVPVPLPAGCCISGDAFVRIRFVGVNCDDGFRHPLLYVAAPPCVPCDQYFTTLLYYPTVTEVCSVLEWNLWYRVNAECCEAVGTERQTWGKVKGLYR